MKIRSILFGVAQLILVLVLLWLLQLGRAQRERIYALEGEITNLKTAKMAVTPRPLPPTGVNEKTLVAPISAPIPSTAAMKAYRDREEAQLKNPDMVFTMTKTKQRMMQKRFDYLFSAMSGLDPNMAAKLKVLLIERDAIAADAFTVAHKAGLAENSAEYSRLVAEVTGGVRAEISALLGGTFPEFERLEKLAGSMTLLDNAIGGDMAFAGVPLSPEQKLSLAAIMTDIHYSPDDPEFEAVMAPVDPATGLKPINALLLEKAANLLSPQQLAVLRAYQDEQVAFQTMGRSPR